MFLNFISTTLLQAPINSLEANEGMSVNISTVADILLYIVLPIIILLLLLFRLKKEKNNAEK